MTKLGQVAQTHKQMKTSIGVRAGKRGKELARVTRVVSCLTSSTLLRGNVPVMLPMRAFVTGSEELLPIA